MRVFFFWGYSLQTEKYTQYKESVHNLSLVFIFILCSVKFWKWFMARCSTIPKENANVIHEIWSFVSVCIHIIEVVNVNEVFNGGMSQLGIIIPNHIIYFNILPTIYEAHNDKVIFFVSFSCNSAKKVDVDSVSICRAVKHLKNQSFWVDLLDILFKISDFSSPRQKYFWKNRLCYE